jgi:RNA polymerase sigma-70 factor (ECF subfamily)
MIQVALTPAEQQYASENYNLVNTFLLRKHLDENEYFDVVIFGYIRAVQQYLNKPELSKFKFSTIAWRKMNDCLISHYRYMKRAKRSACVVSLEDGILTYQPSAPDYGMLDFETEQILLELASKLSKQQMNAVRMKFDGYSVREIAKHQGLKVKEIKLLLESSESAVFAACKI